MNRALRILPSYAPRSAIFQRLVRRLLQPGPGKKYRGAFGRPRDVIRVVTVDKSCNVQTTFLEKKSIYKGMNNLGIVRKKKVHTGTRNKVYCVK